MGLCATAKGLNEETEFHCGYFTYHRFIEELVRGAYDDRYYKIYTDSINEHRCFTLDENMYWNSHFNAALDILIFHSDCDGSFTPKECRAIYNAIKDLHSDLKGHNYETMKPYNMLEHWKDIFLHCAKRRVNLYYH